MEIRIKYSNGLPTYRYTTKGNAPIEVIVGKERENTDEVVQYLNHIGYVLKGVTNRNIEEIEEIELSELPFGGGITQRRDSIKSGPKDMDKYSTVIYDITAGVINETLYMTKNQSNKGPVSKKKVGLLPGGVVEKAESLGNQINYELMNKEGKDRVTILQVMAIVMKYIPGYSLEWNKDTKKVELREDTGKKIKVDEIKEDDVFTFFKLYNLIVGKGYHNGVFMINAMNISEDVLQGMLALIEVAYKGEALVFLYNAEYVGKGVKRQKMVLPKYKR